MILQLTRLLAPPARIEFIRWRDQRLKILHEEIMFLFSGPGSEPIHTHTFRVTFVILFWSDLKLHFSSHEIHASFPWARTRVTRIPVPFLSQFTAAHYTLRIVELLKLFEFFACEEHQVVARWQEILWWRDHGRSSQDFPFSSGYRSRPELGGSRILTWFSA
jgi:hypothetical protein